LKPQILIILFIFIIFAEIFYLKILPLILVIHFSIALFAQNEAYSIFNKSYQLINSSNSMRYINIANERINGKYFKDESLVKVCRAPFKIYILQKKEGGAEILYNSTIDKEKALVNPQHFPYINLNLSPYGSLMRKNTHHTIFQADIKYTYDILNYAIKNRNSDDLIKYKGKVKISDHILYKLELTNKDFSEHNYVIKDGEDITEVAKKERVGSYKILELNPNYPFYDSVKDGDKILVPNYYSKSITLYIDTQTFLPYYIKIYDEKGLYESYFFKNLILNYHFSKDEFLDSYSEYGF